MLIKLLSWKGCACEFSHAWQWRCAATCTLPWQMHANCWQFLFTLHRL